MIAQSYSRPSAFLLPKTRTPRAAPRVTQVVCSQVNNRYSGAVNHLLACAAALALVAQPASAGVTLVKPQLKKAFFDDAPQEEAAPKKREFKQRGSKSSSSQGGVSLPSISAPSLGAPSIDARSIALPGSIGAVVGLGFLLTKLDPKFGEILVDTSNKDSTTYGVGYESRLKTKGGVQVPYYDGTLPSPSAQRQSKSGKKGGKKK
eukprot:TRINITY_DN1312_c0_g1_i1.p2 TRINITY_DN1312_c0_g1~~TRINITY_DN1312_c0_g1_i1.p2  ORF type:complete len:205 (-),score=39.78 TRINITY_DN1312_c0_g1_i1:135-749(-)